MTSPAVEISVATAAEFYRSSLSDSPMPVRKPSATPEASYAGFRSLRTVPLSAALSPCGLLRSVSFLLSLYAAKPLCRFRPFNDHRRREYGEPQQSPQYDSRYGHPVGRVPFHTCPLFLLSLYAALRLSEFAARMDSARDREQERNYQDRLHRVVEPVHLCLLASRRLCAPVSVAASGLSRKDARSLSPGRCAVTYPPERLCRPASAYTSNRRKRPVQAPGALGRPRPCLCKGRGLSAA